MDAEAGSLELSVVNPSGIFGPVPTRQLPNWLVGLAARFDPGMRTLVPMLGKIRNASSEKAERVLGWKPRSREEAIIASADSLMKFGIVGPSVPR
jgi:nucleoside-diphosphate-sugar epimerase